MAMTHLIVGGLKVKRNYIICFFAFVMATVSVLSGCVGYGNAGVFNGQDETVQDTKEDLQEKYKELIDRAEQIYYCYPDKKVEEEKIDSDYGIANDEYYYGVGKDFMCLTYSEGDRFCTYYRRNPVYLGKKTRYGSFSGYTRIYKNDELTSERFTQIKDMIKSGNIELIEGQSSHADYSAMRLRFDIDYGNANDIWLAANDDIDSDRIIVCGGGEQYKGELFFLIITTDNMEEIKAEFNALDEETRQNSNIVNDNSNSIEVLRQAS